MQKVIFFYDSHKHVVHLLTVPRMYLESSFSSLMGSLRFLTFRLLISPLTMLPSLSSEFPLDTAGGTIKIDLRRPPFAACLLLLKREMNKQCINRYFKALVKYLNNRRACLDKFLKIYRDRLELMHQVAWMLQAS